MSLKRALIIPDSHIPYEDKRAFGLMLKALRLFQPHEVVILGDFCDFYFVNSHGKHPEMGNTLKEEIEACNKRLDEIEEAAPEAKRIFIEGNHEYRFERYIFNKAPDLFNLTETSRLLGMDLRESWQWVPYGPNQLYRILGSKLKARHEPGANSAQAAAKRAMTSLVYGHIHRIEESHIVGIEGDNHVAFSVGWLGDKRLDKVYGYVKNHHQWQLGFGSVLVDEQTGYFYHRKHHILDNYTVELHGELIR